MALSSTITKSNGYSNSYQRYCVCVDWDDDCIHPLSSPLILKEVLHSSGFHKHSHINPANDQSQSMIVWK